MPKRRKPLASLVLLLIVATICVGCPPVDKTRILWVGDSWAWFIHIYGSIPEALHEAGIHGIEEAGELATIPGSWAADWVKPEALEVISSNISLYPRADVVMLSLGGNDLIDRWNAGMSIDEELALCRDIVASVNVVVQHILSQSPALRIVISSYDYTNYIDKHPYTDPTYLEEHGNPTPARANHVLGLLEIEKKELALRYDRVEYIDNLGLMQFEYGFPEEGIAPRTTPYPGTAPDYTPFMGGLPDKPSPAAAMWDSIHLTPEGFGFVGRNCAWQFLVAYFQAHLVSPR